MCECIRHDVALALPLQAIIADCGGCLHRRLDIARFDEPPLFLRMICPHSSKAIRLQLHADLKLICLNLVRTTLGFLHLGQNTKQILHVMAYFMGNNIT